MATLTSRPLAWFKIKPQVRKSFDEEDLRRLGELLPGATPPSKEELFNCLRLALEKVEACLLSEGFPKHAAQAATEKAGNTAIDAICEGRAQRMTTLARRKWLWVIARNAVVTLVRRKRTVSLRDDLMPPASVTWIDLHEQETVLEAVRQLPPDMWLVVEAVYFAGLTGRKAAGRLGIPEATFRRRHAEAVRLLRDIFQRLSREF
jgi:hypothetical protein